jgi:hypothetical protein
MGDNYWDIDKVLMNIMKGQDNKLSVTTSLDESNTAISESSISRCLIVIAYIIQDNGDVYLPILDKLINELENYRHLNNLKKLAIQLSERHPLNNFNHIQNPTLIELPYNKNI